MTHKTAEKASKFSVYDMERALKTPDTQHVVIPQHQIMTHPWTSNTDTTQYHWSSVNAKGAKGYPLGAALFDTM